MYVALSYFKVRGCVKARLGDVQVSFFAWWDMLLTRWLKASADVRRQLARIFHTSDDNGDGVIDCNEFEGMSASFVPPQHYL